MRVLSAILAQAWRVTHDVAGMGRRVIEGRCKKAHEMIRVVRQNSVGGFHRAADALVRSLGHCGPGLRDGVDASLRIRVGTERGAAVEKTAKVPIAIPGEKFDRVS